MMTNQTVDSWILVTGGGKGIGKAISEKLGASGYHLILVGRDETALHEQSEKIKYSSSVRVQIFKADLSVSGAAGELFGTIQAKGIPLPLGMVCNAGDYGVLGPLHEVSISDWKRSFDLNFFSIAELIQQYVILATKSQSQMRRKIILMSGSGLGGAQVWPGISAYACAKSALYRLMEVVHEEIYDKGFDINCVAPGAVKTGITDQAERAGAKSLGRLYDASIKVKSDGGDSPNLAADVVLRLLGSQCEGLSGRLVSAKWDRKFLDNPSMVTANQDLLRLRRIDNELFRKN